MTFIILCNDFWSACAKVRVGSNTLPYRTLETFFLSNCKPFSCKCTCLVISCVSKARLIYNIIFLLYVLVLFLLMTVFFWIFKAIKVIIQLFRMKFFIFNSKIDNSVELMTDNWCFINLCNGMEYFQLTEMEYSCLLFLLCTSHI